MNAVYTPVRDSSGHSYRAIALGFVSTLAAFALLPVLTNLPDPFAPPKVIPLKPVADTPPVSPPVEPPKPPEKTKKIEKPKVDQVIPDVPLDMIPFLLNPTNSNVGVYFDFGTSFTEDDTDLEVFLIDQVDKKPGVLVAVSPVYPYSRKGENGDALIEFIIAPDGRVIRPRVIRASHWDFGEAAIESVKKSKWTPGEVNGKAVQTLVRLPVHFKK